MSPYSPKNLKPGDVLLFGRKTSKSFITRSIRFVQGNRCVHVAIVVRGGVNPLIAEIDSDYPVRISSYYKSSEKEIPAISRLENVTIDEASLYSEAFHLVGTQYSKRNIVDVCLNHLFNRLYSLVGMKYSYRPFFYKGRPVKYVCSTLTSYLLSKASTHQYNPHAEPDNFVDHPFKVIYPGGED